MCTVKLLALMALSARRSVSSTELYFQFNSDSEVLFIEVWGQGALIGYARLVRVRSADEIRDGHPVATFELAELLSLHSPCPGPLVSLSGALLSRRERLEEPSGCCFSALPEGLTPAPSPQLIGGVCPHEA